MNKLIKIISALAITTASTQVFSAQPNIVFIMSDDHASNAISAYNSRLSEVFKTPNIDRLAKEGLRFNGMYANNAICTPSRAAILTGNYSHENGVKTLADTFDGKQDNLAKRLQKSGYETAIIGKWHLRSEPTGFDYYNVLPNQGKYYDPKFKEKGKAWKNGNQGGETVNGYVTDIITNKSIDWLKNRDDKKPFMLMVQHKAPHGPWLPAKRHENVLKDTFIPEPDSLYNRAEHGPTDAVIIDGKKGQQFGSSVSRRMEGRSIVTRMTEPTWPTGQLKLDTYEWNQVVSAGYQKYLKDYLRTLTSLDEGVGQILDYLDDNGLAENTIVVYTSDQGMLLGEHDYYDKRWIYEESIKMPFLVRFPKMIPEGSVTDELFLNLDIAPTLLNLAGVNSSDMQGQSFLNVLHSPRTAQGRNAIYYRYWMHMAHHFVPAHYGIRTKKHKLAFFYGLPLDAAGAMPAATPPYWELYDLKRDPNEMYNIYPDSKNAELKAELKNKLLKLKQQVGDLDSVYPELQAVVDQHWQQ